MLPLKPLRALLLLALATLVACRSEPVLPLPTPVPRTPVQHSPRAITPANAKQVKVLQCVDRGVAMVTAFSPDGRLLAIPGGSRLIVYDAHSLAELRLIDPQVREKSPPFTTSLAFSPDGTVLAAGSEDGYIRLFEPLRGTLLRTCGPHTGNVIAVAFSADGQTLASAGWDSRLRVWRVADGTLLHTSRGTEPLKRRGERPGCAMRAAFSPDGTLVAWACNESIGLFRVEDGMRLRTLRMRGDQIFGTLSASDQVFGLAFSPDGAMLAAESMHWLRVWRLASQGPALLWDREMLGCECGLAFSADGQMLARGGLILVSAAEGREVWHSGSEQSRPGQAVAFSPDGALIATAGESGVHCIWGVQP